MYRSGNLHTDDDDVRFDWIMKLRNDGLMKLKKSNGGFSLIELIIVIAIMAVLIGVLAPSVMNQLEKAKIAKDKATIDAIATAVLMAWSDPDVTNKPPVPDNSVVSIPIGVVVGSYMVIYSGSESNFASECQTILGYSQVRFDSMAFSGVTSLKTEINSVTGKVQVTAVGSSVELPDKSIGEYYVVK